VIWCCDVCGKYVNNIEVLTDSSFDMAICDNGHVFCVKDNEHKGFDTAIDPISCINTGYYHLETYTNGNGWTPKFHADISVCPVCNFKHLITMDAMDYLYKIVGSNNVYDIEIDYEDILKTIRENFESYSEFRKWVDEK
jgi:hypothetical protein